MRDKPEHRGERSPQDSDAPISFTAVGQVRTDHVAAAATPIQAQRDLESAGRVEIYPAYRSGLRGLDGFDYALLVTHLDRSTPPRSDPDSWLVVPFLLADTGREVGVFATRHPNRPNAIGVSLVRITAVGDDGFGFAGVDLLDGTPVLDIKPWVPAFDVPQRPPTPIRTGWYEDHVLDRRGVSPRDLA